MQIRQLDSRRGPPLPTAGAGTMAAIVQERYGSAPEGLLRLAEIDRPTIGDDGILVRVHAASVDRGTWHIMSGLPYPIRLAGFGLRRPKYANPGRSLAGTVEAVGAGVTGFAPGDEVYGTSTSTFAEYAAARPGKLARKPANLSFDQAAAVPISGGTALQAVRDHGRVQAGDKVLIIGASGGVGTFAVQIAKASGAEVTGVCSTGQGRHGPRPGRRRRHRLHACGLRRRRSPLRRHPRHRRQRPAVPAAACAHPAGTAGHRRRGDRRTTARRHRAARSGPSCCPRSSARSWARFVGSENAADLDALRELIEAGEVVPAIDRTYPLAEAAGGDPPPAGRTGPRQARHLRLIPQHAEPRPGEHPVTEHRTPVPGPRRRGPGPVDSPAGCGWSSGCC